MLGSIAILTFGTASVVFIQSLWQLYLLWGVVVGIGIGGTAGVLGATVASRWFLARRGLVVGILSSGHAAGQMVFLPVLMAVIVFGSWRYAMALLSAVLLAVILPLVVLLMKDDPSEVGATLDGSSSVPGPTNAGSADKPSREATISIRVAARNPAFWLLAGSFFICGGTSGGLIGTHLIPYSIDHGISEVGAAGAIGLMGLMNFVGTTGSGWLSDRVDKRKLLAAVYAFRAVSLIILPFVSDFSGLTIFAIVYGLDWLATGPPTVGLVADHFGRRSVGGIMGWNFLSHQVGAAIMAYVGGAMRVSLGAYVPAFLMGAILAFVAAGLALRVDKPQLAASAQPLAGAASTA